MVSGQAALKRIICDLAPNHPEINDRVCFSYVFAPDKPGGTVTRTREVFDFDRMVAAGANVTADHILTEKAACSNVSVPLSAITYTPLTGLEWSVATESPSDVYNINGGITILVDSLNGTIQVTLHVYVDGDTSTDYGAGMVFCAGPSSGNAGGAGPFFGSITGLAAGSHTIGVYATYTEILGNTPANIPISGFAFCQRVF